MCFVCRGVGKSKIKSLTSTLNSISNVWVSDKNNENTGYPMLAWEVSEVSEVSEE